MLKQILIHNLNKKTVAFIVLAVLLFTSGALAFYQRQAANKASGPEAQTVASPTPTDNKTDEKPAANKPEPAKPSAPKPGSPTPAAPSSPSGQPAPPVNPPPTPPPSGVCSGAAWTPGSSDPWGGCWPGPNNTGVPSGVVLSAYTGSCTITAANTVIDAKTVNCILTIRAANVTITRSQINGGVNIPSDAPSSASFTISDSEIAIPNLGTGIMRRNFTATRVEITGGVRGVYCQTNCLVQDTWVHAQGADPGGDQHFSGMRMEQYTTYRHNSITCEAARGPGTGCSAGLTGYGDFAPIQNNLIERNLFYRGGGGGSTICAYGGSSGDDGSKPYGHLAANIRFIGNRFVLDPETGHCGNLETVLDFDVSRPGNQWTDNLFDNGTPVSPN